MVINRLAHRILPGRVADALFQDSELIAQCRPGGEQWIDDRQQRRVAGERFANALCPSDT